MLLFPINYLAIISLAQRHNIMLSFYDATDKEVEV